MGSDLAKQKVRRQKDYLKHREERLRASNEYYSRSRTALFNALGWICIRCGFSDPRALQIDHIHGGGGRHMKRITSRSAYYNDLLKDPQLKEKYQILCANCNWIKHIEDNEAKRN